MNTATYYIDKLADIAGWTEKYRCNVELSWLQLLNEIEEELWLAHLGVNGHGSDQQLEDLAKLSDELYSEYPELFV